MPTIVEQIVELAANSDFAKFKFTDDNGGKDKAPLAKGRNRLRGCARSAAMSVRSLTR